MDHRAFSIKKLVAPYPLPHVSRKALKRVKDNLPIPTICHLCESDTVALFSNAEIYGREFGKWPYMYLCLNCRAYVGLHPDTDLPLGTLANEPIRQARKQAKNHFNTLLNSIFQRNRKLAYLWLASKMEIDLSVCHFAMFNEADAIKALNICFTEVKRINENGK